MGYLSGMMSDKIPHDAAYKAFFSNPDMVRSLLQDFVPYDFVREFDFQTLTPCKSSFVGPKFVQRHEDIIWRVKWRNEDCYICIMLEFQSSQDQHMALRILTYTALLLNEHLKNSKDKSEGKLPPVFPIVLYNGEMPWKCPLNIHDLISFPHEALASYQPRQKYFLVDEKHIPKKLLAATKGYAKYIFEAEQADSGDSLYQIAVNFSEARPGDLSDSLKRVMFQWLLLKIRKIDPAWLETMSNKKEEDLMLIDLFEAQMQKIHAEKQIYIDKGIEQGMQQGVKHGMQLGKMEGMRNQKNTLLEMLAESFGDIPAAWQEIIESLADPVVLKDLIKSVWKVESMGDFELLLKNSVKQ